MITNCTTVRAGTWTVKFTVYDNKDWLVTISNDELEIGASSDFCQNNWNKGLAEAVDNIATMLDENDIKDLFCELAKHDSIDNNYCRFLKKNYIKFTVAGYDRYEPFDEIEKEFDRLEDAQSLSGRIIDDGGEATITDEHGNEYDPYP